MHKMPNGINRYIKGNWKEKILNTPENRFKVKCNEPNENGCIIWNGHLKGLGYGQFLYEGKQMYAHRYAYEAYYKMKIPSNVCVCHKCDVPSCVNPEHLFLASKKANNEDSLRKKRGRWDRNPILTSEQRKDIYLKMKEGISVVLLSKEYGVSKTAIYNNFYTKEKENESSRKNEASS